MTGDVRLAPDQDPDGLAPDGLATAPSGRQPRISAMPREARPYQGHRAGIVSRMLACAIDFVVVAAGLAAVYGAWSLVLFLWRPSRFRFPAVSTDWVLAAAGALLFAYLAYSWRAAGRTWGDLLLGLRVVNRRGNPPGVVGCVLRSALCVAFPIGILYVAVSRSNRSVADVVLRTSVIYDWGPVTIYDRGPVTTANGGPPGGRPIPAGPRASPGRSAPPSPP